MVLDSTQAADQAKAAVAQNSRLLQQKLAEKNKLLSQLEQAKMQEQMNKAMTQLNETVGDDVPTLKEVSDKIEARYAKAKASSELQETSVESRIQEVETRHCEPRGAGPPQPAPRGARPQPRSGRAHPAELVGDARQPRPPKSPSSSPNQPPRASRRIWRRFLPT